MSSVKQKCLPWIVTVIVITCIWLLLDLFFWPNQYRQVDQLSQAIVPLHHQRNMAQRKLEQFRLKQEEWEQDIQSWKAEAARFSVSYDSAFVVKHMADSAQDSEVTIEHIEWLGEQRTAERVQSPFIVELSGHYTQISDFLLRIGEPDPVVVFSQVTWKRDAPDSDRIDVQAQASLYWLISLPEALQ